MNLWLSALLVAFLTALRFVIIPAFVVLALISFGVRGKRGAWIPLWKLGLVLLGIALVSTLFFAVLWKDAVAR